MLRCGQMLIGQALLFLHLGRDWRWNAQCRDRTYLRILRMFEDRRTAPYSIHQIALMGASEGKQVGEWFGPNTVAQVLRQVLAHRRINTKLSVYDEWSSVAFHVALDNTIVINDVRRLCTEAPRPGELRRRVRHWKPLVLVIPLRLGITDINPVYVQAIKASFTFKQSLGLIGGKPNHALYFIGCVGNDVIFLDPHTTQSIGVVNGKEHEHDSKMDSSYHCSQANRLHILNMDPSVAVVSTPSGNDVIFLDPHTTQSIGVVNGKEHEHDSKMDSSYHCSQANRLHILNMDPSVAVSFFCKTEAEFEGLCECIRVQMVTPDRKPLVELREEQREHWTPLDDTAADALGATALSCESQNMSYIARHAAAGPNGTMASSGRKSNVHVGGFSLDNGLDVVIASPEPLYLDYDSDIIPVTLEPCSRVIVPTSRIPQQAHVPSERIP
ncbi:hypothetical protein J6590_069783 [Homalodisca vitripennis]|nr:hypothetical protein J6590_069783 [Homalodisca vitripennis]